MSSYGPSMALAAELLDHGERDVVIVYLDKCARFWAFGHGQIGQWKLEIQAAKSQILVITCVHKPNIFENRQLKQTRGHP